LSLGWTGKFVAPIINQFNGIAMKNFSAALLACLVLLTPGMPLAHSHSGTVTMAFDLSAQPDTEPTQLWIPYPVSDENQLITDIAVEGDFAKSAVYTDRNYQTPILYARWDKGVRSRKLTFSFHVVRQEVVRRDLPSKEASWNPADFRPYLAPTSLGPINLQVQDLAYKITRGKTGVKDKARAIYDWIIDNMHRDPDTVGCGVGDVISLLASAGGKCTDIHSVFVTLCRAAGVPAQEIFGIRQGKAPVVDITSWQHCWAEFYLPGYGWVPVDPADVLKKMLVKDLKRSDPEIKEAREYFWGAWDPYRVQLALGRDVQLNPAQDGPPLNNFGYPFAQVGKHTLDWYQPENFTYKITYRQP
jgi:transglutaminase-like putative cysteine protease